MHYDIEYSNISDEATKDKAIKDCMAWLGKRQFNKVARILGEAPATMNPALVKIGLAMQGIQGYPAEVMIERYLGK